MDEILRSNARTGSICDLTVIGVAAVSIAAAVGAPFLWLATSNPWLAIAAGAAVIAAAVTAAVLIQGRAVRRHGELCAAYQVTR